MKELIAVTGKSNRGKSYSVTRARQCILHRHPDACEESVPGRPRARHRDVGCIITIGDIKIGIESQGDPGSRLIRTSLPLFAEKQCQLIVCAARDGNILEGVERFSIEHGYKMIRICKRRLPPEERESNAHSTVQEILEAVENHIRKG